MTEQLNNKIYKDDKNMLFPLASMICKNPPLKNHSTFACSSVLGENAVDLESEELELLCCISVEIHSGPYRNLGREP